MQNTVRFAFFGGEETGAEGSSGYLEGLSTEDRKKIKLYLNVDMVASQNGGYFVQGGKGGDKESCRTPRVRPRSGRCSPTSWSRPA